MITLLMVGNAGAMALSGFFLSRKTRWSYLLAVIGLTINIILTVTDQIGFFDWITLLIDLGLMIILFSLRKEYG